jgi:processive 1,2-diacylglycerol beta-glucosyltransferase
MGGGLGMGPIKKIAKQLDDLRGDFQIIVVCGRNRLLYKWFVKNKPDFKKKLFHFGYTEGIPKLMDFCDIIITKGGGITVSEALAKGLALVITEALPGQEERNVKYLLEQGAIVEVDDPENIGSAVQELIDDKERLLALKTKAKEISFIDSSLKIVDLILSQIK